MAMVYDNVKGSFKDGQQKKEKNNSGMMSKELSSLSNAGPTNHSLAYITPEEEKLLAKATGKETITTAYGIPTYESEMTVKEMESKITNNRNEKAPMLGETKKEPVEKPMTPQFNPNKDYHLTKFLQEQQSLMSSKEDYFPPQP